MPQTNKQITVATAAQSRLLNRWTFSIIALLLLGLAAQGKIYAGDNGNTHYGVGALTLADMNLGNNNSAFGEFALYRCRGDDNTAIGFNTLASDTSGAGNTASGFNALSSNDGYYNTASGASALENNTTAGLNTATGYSSLFSNTTGARNMANGAVSLYHNTTGSLNTASGSYALWSNTTGDFNTATGYQALLYNTTGSNNEANGGFALFNNTTGNNNMANGANALYANTAGYYNMANGSFALAHNTIGNYNVAEGLNALYKNTTGSNNVAIGLAAGGDLTTGGGNIDIGNRGAAAESNTTRIGTSQNKAFIAGVKNAVVSGGVAVFVSASGQLGTNPSSKRFKQNIAAMDKESETILALHPVTFRYKEELDPNNIAQFGLIAEEVAEINPDLVTRDDKGEVYSVRYEAVNAMLLNEFLKEHRTVEELQAAAIKQENLSDKREKDFQTRIAEQEKKIDALTEALQNQATQIEKVSAQLALRKPAAPAVADNR